AGGLRCAGSGPAFRPTTPGPPPPGDPPMLRLLATAALAAVVAAAGPAQDRKTIGSVDRKDPRIDQLIPRDAKIEVIEGGFKWTEGPVWDKKAAALFFTDIPNNRVMRWSAKDGMKEFLKPSGYTGTAPFKGYEPG